MTSSQPSNPSSPRTCTREKNGYHGTIIVDHSHESTIMRNVKKRFQSRATVKLLQMKTDLVKIRMLIPATIFALTFWEFLISDGNVTMGWEGVGDHGMIVGTVVSEVPRLTMYFSLIVTERIFQIHYSLHVFLHWWKIFFFIRGTTLNCFP